MLKIYKSIQKIIPFIVILITFILFITSIIRIYLELYEPIIVKGIAVLPPRTTFYGGILLNANPSYLQSTNYSCGQKVLSLACQLIGINVTEEELLLLTKRNKKGTSMLSLAKGANKVGLKSYGLFLTFDDLRRIKKPVIAFFNNNHFVLINKIQDDKILITDPSAGKVLLGKNRFLKLWKGYVLALEKEENSEDT